MHNPRPSASVTGKRRVGLGLIAVPAIIFACSGFARRWTCDDAFIGFRVIENVLAGFGPIYNVGERAEVYTNPLWMLVLTTWGFVGLPIEIGSVAIGLVLSVAVSFSPSSERFAPCPTSAERRTIVAMRW